MAEEVKESQVVLLIWSGSTPPKRIEEIVVQLNSKVGPAGKVSVEHEERLQLSSHPDSSFDAVLSGVTLPSQLVHSLDLLAEIARILKPSGKLTLAEPTGTTGNLRLPGKVASALKLSGFVDISAPKELKLNADESRAFKQELADVTMVQQMLCHLKEVKASCTVCLLQFMSDILFKENISAFKPSFEVGKISQLPLSFAPKSASKPMVKDENIEKIWTLSAQDIDDDEIDILDSDTLLDEEDLRKPDPASLKSDCSTNKAGKKKACKNCTCGLAEELDQGKTPEKKTVTSSCGSCYLGDAFRCASCPYLGMPAFKPGEKVALTSRQLKGDL